MSVRPPLRMAYTGAPGGTALAAIHALENLSRAVIAPVISLAGVELLGSARNLSIALFTASIVSLTIMLLSGSMIRRISRKFVFTFACIMAIASMGFYMSDAPWAFVAASAMRSAGAGLVLVCVSLYTMDFIPKQELAKVESRKILFSASVWIMFPAIGTWLWVNVGKEAPFVLSGIFACGLLAVFWWLRITEAEQIKAPNDKNLGVVRNVLSYLKDGHMRMAYIIALARSTAWVMFFTYGPIYIVAAGVPVEWVGLITGLVVSVLLLSPRFAALAQWFGIRRSIVYSFFIGGVLFAIIGLIPQPTVWAFGLFLAASLTMDMLDTIGNLPFMRMVKKSVRVEMTTVFSTWREFSMVVTPGAAVILLTFLPLQSMFLVLGATFLATGAVVKNLPKRVG